MYNEVVLSHFMEPNNVGMITGADGVGQVGNLRRGDIIKIYLRIVNNVIDDAKFKTFGDVAALAASDVTCDLIKGKTVEAAIKIKDQEIIDALHGLPKYNLHCAMLAREAVIAAVQDYYKTLEKEKNKKK